MKREKKRAKKNQKRNLKMKRANDENENETTNRIPPARGGKNKHETRTGRHLVVRAVLRQRLTPVASQICSRRASTAT